MRRNYFVDLKINVESVARTHSVRFEHDLELMYFACPIINKVRWAVFNSDALDVSYQDIHNYVEDIYSDLSTTSDKERILLRVYDTDNYLNAYGQFVDVLAHFVEDFFIRRNK